MKSALYKFKYELLKPGTRAAFARAMRMEALPPDEVEAESWRLTRALVAYAYRHVPFYRQRFDQLGLQPEDLRERADFQKIPVLTKQDIRDHRLDLFSDEARFPHDFNTVTTGGSTGEPLTVYHDKRAPRAALLWRMLSWWELGPDSDWASVYRETRTSWRLRLREGLINWPGRRLLLDASHLTEEAMREFLRDFNRLQPPLLHGYVGGVDRLAEFVLSQNRVVHAPRAIWLTSSPFTRVQAQRIESAFHAPVFDQYGCCEVFYLAAECPAHAGLHMFQDRRRIEFLDETGRACPAGVYGAVTITDLDSRLFPLIRYANGDRGRALAARCSCGRGLPLMDKVQGRISDRVLLPGGGAISGEFLTTIFDETPDAVRQFQVHQSADYNLTIRVIPNPGFAGLDARLEAVRRKLAALAGPGVAVRVESVRDIPQERGKLRFVSSALTQGARAVTGQHAESAR